MKTYKDEDGKEVKEFCFEDWINKIDFEVTPGKRNRKDLVTNEVSIEYLPIEQYRLIKQENEKLKQENEKLYWEKIELEFESLKQEYNQRESKSGNKELLRNDEIEKYKDALIEDSKKPIFGRLPYTEGYKGLYRQLIVNGQSGFNNNDFNEDTIINFRFIKVEAFAKFLQWLETPDAEQPKQKRNNIEYTLDASPNGFWNKENLNRNQDFLHFESCVDSSGIIPKTSIIIEDDEAIENIKIYSPRLALLLFSTEIPAINHATGNIENINGAEFQSCYIEAYYKGRKYFDENFAVRPDTFFGANADKYIGDLHFNYFHKEHKPGKEGWKYWATKFVHTVSDEVINEYGYYCGIVSKLQELMQAKPTQFINFDVCEKPEHKAPQGKPDKQDKMEKTFSEFILHTKRIILAEKLKQEFNTERGKGIRLLIEAMQLHDPALLTIENRQRKMIYNAMCKFFGRNIGTYNSIFDYKFDIVNDKLDFMAVKAKLDYILKSIRKQGKTT